MDALVEPPTEGPTQEEQVNRTLQGVNGNGMIAQQPPEPRSIGLPVVTTTSAASGLRNVAAADESIEQQFSLPDFLGTFCLHDGDQDSYVILPLVPQEYASLLAGAFARLFNPWNCAPLTNLSPHKAVCLMSLYDIDDRCNKRKEIIPRLNAVVAVVGRNVVPLGEKGSCCTSARAKPTAGCNRHIPLCMLRAVLTLATFYKGLNAALQPVRKVMQVNEQGKASLNEVHDTLLQQIRAAMGNSQDPCQECVRLAGTYPPTTASADAPRRSGAERRSKRKKDTALLFPVLRTIDAAVTRVGQGFYVGWCRGISDNSAQCATRELQLLDASRPWRFLPVANLEGLPGFVPQSPYSPANWPVTWTQLLERYPPLAKRVVPLSVNGEVLMETDPCADGVVPPVCVLPSLRTGRGQFVPGGVGHEVLPSPAAAATHAVVRLSTAPFCLLFDCVSMTLDTRCMSSAPSDNESDVRFRQARTISCESLGPGWQFERIDVRTGTVTFLQHAKKDLLEAHDGLELQPQAPSTLSTDLLEIEACLSEQELRWSVELRLTTAQSCCVTYVFMMYCRRQPGCGTQ